MTRKLLFSIFFALLVGHVMGQMSASPATQEVGGSPSSPDIEAKFDVINGPDEIDARWALELGSDWPAEWESWVCDENLCYTPTVSQDPQGSTFGARATQKWSLHCNPDGIVGTGTLLLHITSEIDGDTLTTVEVVYNVTETSTNDLSIEADIELFPNPTTDYFMIDGDARVATVQLYDLVGRELLSANHSQGRRYDVSTYRNGIYLVTLTDDSGEVIKSTRISKR